MSSLRHRRAAILSQLSQGRLTVPEAREQLRRLLLEESDSVLPEEVQVGDAASDANSHTASHAAFESGDDGRACDRIAVIAVAGRFPQADSVDELWQLLRQGGDAITEVPASRWDHSALYHPNREKLGFAYCRWGGFLRDVDAVDADFFDLDPRETRWSSLGERLLLETCWTLFENAGYPRSRLAEVPGCRIGVFTACDNVDRTAQSSPSEKAATLSVTTGSGYLAARVSHFFGLRGPSQTISSMGSSSLVAVHQACQSLRSGESAMAVAGAVNVLGPEHYLGLCNLGYLASDPASRSLAGGDGYLPAEAVGAVLLKPLQAARRDGDSVLAVILGSSQAHAGRASAVSVPSSKAQLEIMVSGLAACGVPAESVAYHEASSPGGALADNHELAALRQLYPSRGCALGSVHANLGYAEAAAGMVSLIKAVLMLAKDQVLPFYPAGFARPALETFFLLPKKPDSWPSNPWPPRVAVSGFGQAGSHAHLVLEQASTVARAAPVQRRRVFVLSARDPQALERSRRRLADHLRHTPDARLDDLAHTLLFGREEMPHRWAFVANGLDELVQALELAGPLPANDSDDPLAALAQRWVAGLLVSWTEQREGGQVVSLPGYPFARQAYRFPSRVAPAFRRPQANQSLDDALLDYLVQVVQAESIEPVQADRLLPAGRLCDSLIQAIEDELRLKMSVTELSLPTTLTELASRLADKELQRFPLSEGQQGLWMMQSLAPQDSLYNASLAARLVDSDFRMEKLEAAWSQVLEWHPELTMVVGEGGRPVQRYRAAYSKPEALPLRDASSAALSALLRELASRPFSLQEGPLARLLVLRPPHGHPVILLSLHHVIIDGTSMMVIWRSLKLAYEAQTNGCPAPWQGSLACYRDFVAWEQAMLNDGRGQAHLKYWRQQLAGPLPLLELPTDSRRGPAGPRALRQTRLEGETAQRLRALADSLRVPLSVLFLGLSKILLWRYSDQTELVVGMPTMGRPEARFHTTVGYFVNMVAMRSRLTPEEPLEAFLTTLRGTVLEGLKHAAYPFPKLVQALAPPRRAFRHPVFDVSFAYQNFMRMGAFSGSQEQDQGGLRLEPIGDVLPMGDGDLGIEVVEDGSDFEVRLDYDSLLFLPASAQAMLDGFVALADQAILGGGGQALRTLQAGRSLSSSTAPSPRPMLGASQPLWSAFCQVARQQPDAPAVMSPDGLSLSYAELCDWAADVAERLGALDVGPGDRVGLLSQRGAAWLAGWLAVIQRGAVLVPLDPELPSARLAQLLEDAQPMLVMACSFCRQQADGLGARLLDLEDRGALETQKSGCEAAPGVAAYLIYTSGSTGTPKGVLGSYRALSSHVTEMIPRYGLKRHDRVLSFAPLGVDTHLEGVLCSLLSGACLLSRPREIPTPTALHELLTRRGVTVTDLPPGYLHEVLLCGQPKPSTLRLVIVGGEALTPATLLTWRAGWGRSCQLLNAYGPTETTITTLLWQDDGREVVQPPIGAPLDGVSVELLRQEAPVPPGAVGEITLGGGRLTLGYWRRARETADRFRPDPHSVTPGGRRYHTGDLGRWPGRTDADLQFRGRGDEQIQVGGFRVEPAEVEAALGTLEGVNACAVLSCDGQLVAFVVPSDSSVAWPRLRQALAARLPAAMVPRRAYLLERLPVAPSGKVDRLALSQRALAPEPLAQATFVRPFDAREQAMAQLWQELLDRPSVGSEENFFDLGGHSLLGLRLITEIERRFGVALPLSTLLETPTVAGLTASLQTASSSPDGQPLCLTLRAGSSPFLALVHAPGGVLLSYRALALALPSGSGCLALTSGSGNLEQMAQQCLALLRAEQPAGPYRLVGWSLGGVVAYEMAQQLLQQGQQVETLVLLDSYHPRLLKSLEKAHPNFDRTDVAEWERSALDNYRPQPYRGSMTLMVAELDHLSPIDRGWSDLVAESRLRLQRVPASHMTMFGDSSLSVLAKALAENFSERNGVGIPT